MNQVIKASKWILLLAILSLGACDKATPNSNREVSGKTEATAVAAVPEPAQTEPVAVNFDPAVTRIPRDFDFYGEDADKVFLAIQAIKVNQNKFESDEKFRTRMKKLGDSVLFGQVKLNGKFAFRLPKRSFLSFTYDANKETFSYMLASKELRDGQFNGIEVGSQGLFLELTNFTGLKYVIGSLKVQPERARSLDGHLDVVLVGAIASPYIDVIRTYDRERYRQFGEAKPIEKRVIRFRLEGAWIVDVAGDVLTKRWALRAP